MKISVIVPIYNVEKYLRRCLESIKNQTFTDWEAICVNDGSPDDSAQILNAFEKLDARFKVVNKENGGLSDARNVGMQYATGDYILFFAGDDKLYDESNQLVDSFSKIQYQTYNGNFNVYIYSKSEVLKTESSLSIIGVNKGDHTAITVKDKDTKYAYLRYKKLNNGYIYNGPFYCEQASNGDFTSTDCNTVLNAEYEAVNKSDIYIALFDQNFSVGTIVELDWAINMDKEIIIFYQKEEDEVFRIINVCKKHNLKIEGYVFKGTSVDIDNIIKNYEVKI